MALLGVAIGSVLQNPLHTTTYLIISPTTKILSHLDHNPIIFHKQFKDFKATFFEFRIKIFY